MIIIMGNKLSNVIEYEMGNSERTCLICWDEVTNIDTIRCNRCNVILHAYCEEIYRGGKGYCKCPHCQQIGTLSN